MSSSGRFVAKPVLVIASALMSGSLDGAAATAAAEMDIAAFGDTADGIAAAPVPTGRTAALDVRLGITLRSIARDDEVRILTSDEDPLADPDAAGAAEPDPDQIAASCVPNVGTSVSDGDADGTECPAVPRLVPSRRLVICVRLTIDIDLSPF